MEGNRKNRTVLKVLGSQVKQKVAKINKKDLNTTPGVQIPAQGGQIPAAIAIGSGPAKAKYMSVTFSEDSI